MRDPSWKFEDNERAEWEPPTPERVIADWLESAFYEYVQNDTHPESLLAALADAGWELYRPDDCEDDWIAVGREPPKLYRLVRVEEGTDG